MGEGSVVTWLRASTRPIERLVEERNVSFGGSSPSLPFLPLLPFRVPISSNHRAGQSTTFNMTHEMSRAVTEGEIKQAVEALVSPQDGDRVAAPKLYRLVAKNLYAGDPSMSSNKKFRGRVGGALRQISSGIDGVKQGNSVAWYLNVGWKVSGAGGFLRSSSKHPPLTR